MAPLEETLTTTLPAGSSTNPVDCRYTGSGLTNAPVSPPTAGLESAPEAFLGMLDGKNFGKLLVPVS